MFVFISLLATVFFAFALIVVLNYVLVEWENTKIDNLASQIKQSDNTNILNKGVASHRFTSVDVSYNLRSSLTHKSFTESAVGFYSKTITVITTQDYASWWSKFISELKDFKTDWKGTLSRWFEFLLSLAKPVQPSGHQPSEQLHKKEEKRMEEVANTIEKVKEAGRDDTGHLYLDSINDASETFSLAHSSQKAIDKTNPNPVALISKDSTKKPIDEATIGLAGFEENRSEKDLTQFEKIEQRILDKLQSSGLKNYDIWIQLGDFYLKYDEKEKAKEIFALVLKQATGEQKEKARDRLISF